MSYIYKQRFKTGQGCSKRVAEHNRHEGQRPLRRCYFYSVRMLLCPDNRWRRDPLEWDEHTEKTGRYCWMIERLTKKEVERKNAIDAAAIALGVGP